MRDNFLKTIESFKPDVILMHYMEGLVKMAIFNQF